MNPYNFEDNVALAATSGLIARGLPAHGPREPGEKPANRVDVTATGWARASNQMGYDSHGCPFYNHYAGTLTCVAITQRGGPAAAQHAGWVAIVRQMVDRPAQFFNLTNLPVYNVLKISEASPAPEENAPTDSDRTTLSFTVEVGILGSALGSS